MSNYDYIIVGAGSAGCVLARRLSDDPSVRVLLLEAGSRDNSVFVHMPAGVGRLLSTRNKYNWYFETEGQKHLGGRRLYWPRGKGLGGSSSINGMIYIRGHARDYDQWRQMGLDGWSYSEVLPYFKRSETFKEGGDDYHGDEGPLYVSPGESNNPMYRAYIEAGQQAGYPYTSDFNGYAQEGFGPYHMTIRDGKRCSAAAGYLTPVLNRPNLTVETGAHTARVLFEKGRAAGVEFVQKKQTHTVWCDKEIVLSGGAVNSPQLLLLSGLGPADYLNKFGIKPVCDLPGVGQNLLDHLDATVVYEASQPLTLYSELSPMKMIGTGLNYMLFGKGAGRSNGLESGGFVKSRPDLEIPDLQIHYVNAPMMDHGRKKADRHGFTAHVCLLRPESRGHIALRSADPLDAPLIQPNYLASQNDLHAMREGVKILRNVFAQKAFDPYRGPELMPGITVQTDEQIENFIRRYSETIYHPVGTCKMGHDEMAVVDQELRVRGVEGLRVVDASVMPTLVGGNTNAPTIMIAEKASDMILGLDPLPAEDVPIAEDAVAATAAE